MYPNQLALNELITQDLNEKKYFSRQSWCSPQKFSGHKVYDVIIVGAGHTGLALAHQLRLLGLGRVLLLDKQPCGKPGPWQDFARMEKLRTSKFSQGPECGNPLLSFKFWKNSVDGPDAFDQIDFIKTEDWANYLRWFKEILQLDVESETEVFAQQWVESANAFEIRAKKGNTERKYYSSMLCLATGMTACGSWQAPKQLVNKTNLESIGYAWGKIDFSKLVGKHVAIIGGGASAFDNALEATKHGAKRADVLARRKIATGKPLSEKLWSGRDDSQIHDNENTYPSDMTNPILRFSNTLDEKKYLSVIRNFFSDGRTTSRPEYQKQFLGINNLTVNEALGQLKIEACKNSHQHRITSEHGFDELYDYVIVATGPKFDVKAKKELFAISNEILTWGDREQKVDLLDIDALPKLSSEYQIQFKSENSAAGKLYCLTDVIHITVGIPALANVIEKVSRSIASQLYANNAQHIISHMEVLNNKGEEDNENYHS
ncbi:NAD(P)-binding domain-containing protein [Vibrio sp. Of7-15]|uniref:NAD(P)-binding domain-containing protein n=1 Tax=Vibrio sp. Of7-15 TaxID=2724879 RepID=UPI001EF346F8|nr:NAD(P)-binding domain-containing protein [Vibrio sp. Of7-15]MCG7498654.1 NAD(P)-binding domain-containing protein [Vibrio sp. Of7-15]